MGVVNGRTMTVLATRARARVRTLGCARREGASLGLGVMALVDLEQRLARELGLRVGTDVEAKILAAVELPAIARSTVFESIADSPSFPGAFVRTWSRLRNAGCTLARLGRWVVGRGIAPDRRSRFEALLRLAEAYEISLASRARFDPAGMRQALARKIVARPAWLPESLLLEDVVEMSHSRREWLLALTRVGVRVAVSLPDLPTGAGEWSLESMREALAPASGRIVLTTRPWQGPRAQVRVRNTTDALATAVASWIAEDVRGSSVGRIGLSTTSNTDEPAFVRALAILGIESSSRSGPGLRDGSWGASALDWLDRRMRGDRVHVGISVALAELALELSRTCTAWGGPDPGAENFPRLSQAWNECAEAGLAAQRQVSGVLGRVAEIVAIHGIHGSVISPASLAAIVHESVAGRRISVGPTSVPAVRIGSVDDFIEDPPASLFVAGKSGPATRRSAGGLLLGELDMEVLERALGRSVSAVRDHRSSLMQFIGSTDTAVQLCLPSKDPAWEQWLGLCGAELEPGTHAPRSVVRRPRFQRQVPPLGPETALAVAERLGLTREPIRVSATSLEIYAACPFRFGVGAVLHLAPPGLTVSGELEPRKLGQLMHECVAKGFEALRAAGRLPLGGGDSYELEGAVFFGACVPIFDAWSSNLPATVWDLQRERCQIALRRLLEAERWRVDEGWVPESFEREFEFEIDPSTVVRGRIDRIDRRGPEHAIERRIVNYKLGPVYGKLDKTSLGVTQFQLPIYRAWLAARDQTSPIDAVFVSLTDGSMSGSLAAAIRSDEEVAKRLEGLPAQLRRFTDGMGAARFPVAPADPPQTCTTCDLSALCRVQR